MNSTNFIEKFLHHLSTFYETNHASFAHLGREPGADEVVDVLECGGDVHEVDLLVAHGVRLLQQIHKFNVLGTSITVTFIDLTISLVGNRGVASSNPVKVEQTVGWMKT